MTQQIVIKTFVNRYEAEAACALLKENGIHARLSATDVAGVQPMIPLQQDGIQLFVKAEDRDRAHDLLAMMTAESGDALEVDETVYDTKYQRRKKMIRYFLIMALFACVILPVLITFFPSNIFFGTPRHHSIFNCYPVDSNPDMDEICLESYNNGKMHAMFSFKNGVPHGLYTEYFFNGKVAMKLDFQDGDIPGEILEYAIDDGSLRSRFMMRNDQLHGQVVEYYPNGHIHQMVHYDEGDINGDVIYFDTDGTELFRITCENNRCRDMSGVYLNDEVVVKYGNGQILEKATYQDGYLEGKMLSYFENGMLKSTAFFQKGKMHGKTCQYSRSGIKLACYEFVHNHDIYQEKYDELGKIIFSIKTR